MANVFKKFSEYVNKPNRSVFDMSFTNNFTTDFGKLTPVFCKEVLPGDSVNINPTFGLNFAPMVYPVQTRMKSHLHFFYVRTRTLWKDWMDFIGNTKDGLIPPYIDFNANSHLLKSCSLADYLGVPTTLVKPEGITTFSAANLQPSFPKTNVASNFTRTQLNTLETFNTLNFNAVTFPKNIYEDLTDVQKAERCYTFKSASAFTPTPSSQKPSTFKVNSNVVFSTRFLGDAISGKSVKTTIRCILAFRETSDNSNEFVYHSFIRLNKSVDIPLTGSIVQTGIDLGDDFTSFFESLLFMDSPDNRDIKIVVYYDLDFPADTVVDDSSQVIAFQTSYTTGVDTFVEASNLEVPPYAENVLPISALPFRAYEAVYNSFYRNPQNNPFIFQDKPEYNRYVSNLDGGKDTTRYDLFNRNWDDDAFTTAVPSPQQGIAPLVGVSSSGEFTFQDDNGTYKAQAVVGDDGDTITAVNILDNSMPSGTTRALVDLVSSGISISDFRNVNALQRWLEKNMRKGLRYKDQIMSHFGSEVEYDELLMPEFIGGVSNDVDVNRIINTTGGINNAPLGSYGGLAQSFGQSDNNITKYCDEHGFIIGILSVVPYANYSQVLPKMFTRRNVLDYYFPEFGAIGMQAITHRDMMPLQSYAQSSTPAQINSDLAITFGYQRPWWDYISSLDEVHGRFRTDYRDYLLNRIFKTNPTLSPDFLTISDDDLNSVFAVEEDTDKILGIIHFKFTKKTTIPEYGIPRLEVD